MGTSSPPLRSYDELARRVLAHAEWPADSRPKVRSLSALFSKFDRGIELEWLSDRSAAQYALAAVLGCPLSSVASGLARNAEVRDAEQRKFRFDDVRFALSLELLEETLPPGLPDLVRRPMTWDRHWWVAPSGSGRTLVGRWLQARGLATYLSDPTPEHARRVLSSRGGPVFLELSERAETSWAMTLNPGCPLCVAAPLPPMPLLNQRHARGPGEAHDSNGWHETREFSAPGAGSWRLFESPDPAKFLAPLCSWLAQRMPKDGSFSERQAVTLISRWAEAGLQLRFGTILGLAGLLDEARVGNASIQSLESLANWYCLQRFHGAGKEGNPDALWLQKQSFQLVCALAERALTDSSKPWGVARSYQEWSELVPLELERAADAEWLRISLARSPARPTVKDLERTISEMAPGAFRVTRALASAGLLRNVERDLPANEQQPEELVLGPMWLSDVALSLGTRRLCSNAASEWGEALLRAHSLPLLVRHLSAEVVRGNWDVVEAAVELDIGANPAHAAAVELCFRCLGLALLLGSEVPQDLLTAIYSQQLDLVVELDEEMPQPRVFPAHRSGYAVDGATPAASHEPLLGLGFFYLAAWALSEHLPARSMARHPLLNPWHESRLDPGLHLVLQTIEAETWDLELHGQHLRPLLCALVDRLAQQKGDPVMPIFANANGSPAALEVPSLILRAYQGQVLEPSTLSWLLRIPQRSAATESAKVSAHELIRELEPLASRRGFRWADFASAVWDVWVKAPNESLLEILFAAESLFLPHAKADIFPQMFAALPRLAGVTNQASLRVPFACLTEEQWSAIFPLLDPLAIPLRVPERALWHSIPVELALRFLRSRPALHAVAIPVLWERNETRLLEFTLSELEKSASAEPGQVAAVFSMVQHAKTSATPEIISVLRAVLARRGISSAFLNATRRWLNVPIGLRGAGWRDAYALLFELEQRRRKPTSLESDA